MEEGNGSDYNSETHEG